MSTQSDLEDLADRKSSHIQIISLKLAIKSSFLHRKPRRRKLFAKREPLKDQLARPRIIRIKGLMSEFYKAFE